MNNPGLLRWLFIGAAPIMGFAGLWWFTPSIDTNFYFEFPVQSASAAVLLVAAVVAFTRGLREHLAHTIGRQLTYTVREAAFYGLTGFAALVVVFDNINPVWSFAHGFYLNGVMLSLLIPVAWLMFNRALHDYSLAEQNREQRHVLVTQT